MSKRLVARQVISHGRSQSFPLTVTLRIVEGTAPVIGKSIEVQLTDYDLTSILASLMAGEEWAKKIAAMAAERKRIEDVREADATPSYERFRMGDPMFIAQRLREVVANMD